MKKKLNSYLYTRGKFGKGFRETVDTDKEFLYSKGIYPTKIRKEDLPEDYIKVHSRVIWYMTGYLKTSGVKEPKYKALEINHLFKDDYLYISYKEPLVEVVDRWGFRDYENADICICGNSIVPIILAIEKYSPEVDTSEVREQIQKKLLWYKENCVGDYKRQFGDDLVDLFAMYADC